MNEKLQRELKAIIIQPIERIAGYLDGAMLTDERLAKAIEDEKKTLRGCYDYIKEQAKKAAGSFNALMIEDGQVFDWAKEYYLSETKEAEKPTEEKPTEEKPTEEKPTEEKPAEEKKKPAKKKATKKEDPVEETTEAKKEEQINMELTEDDEEEDIFG